MKKFLRDNGANILTILRIISVSLIFWLTPFKNVFWQLITILIYTVIAISDTIDGWFARRFGRVTEIGKILDPVADKILILTFLPLLEMGALTSFPVFVILAREFAVSALRIRMAQLGHSISASKWGKIKTILTLPLCGILLARVNSPVIDNIPVILMPLYKLLLWVKNWPQIFINFYIWVTVIITIVSFFDYFRDYVFKYVKIKKWSKNRIKNLKILIPNSFTILNFSMGILALYFVFKRQYELAVLCILIGIFADALDGPLARKLSVSSKFGAKLDSQADMISFGIAPTFLIFSYFYSIEILWLKFLGFLLSVFYGYSVWFRLNRFNKNGHTDFFEGLPSPAGASFILIGSISTYLNEKYIFSFLVLIVSLLMISHLPYAHLGLVKKRKFFMFLAVCTFISTVLTFIKLMHPELFNKLYAYEILFGVITLYGISPILFFKKRGDYGINN